MLISFDDKYRDQVATADSSSICSVHHSPQTGQQWRRQDKIQWLPRNQLYIRSDSLFEV